MDESDLANLEQTLLDTKKAGHTYLQAAFTKFIFRWVLLLPLYLLFVPIFPSLKWTSLILLPLFLYSLYQIYAQKKRLAEKIKDIQILIDSIKELEATSKK